MTDFAPLPERPGEAELDPLIAADGAGKAAERNTRLVDPQITPRDRLLVGARLTAGSQGADRAPYEQWKQDRTQPTPVRRGTNMRQAGILAAQSSLDRARAMGADDQGPAWLNATGADPIDVARFDRAAKTGRADELWTKMLRGNLADDAEAFELADRVTKAGEVLEQFDDDLTLGSGRVVDIGDRVRVHWDDEPAPGVVSALLLESLPIDAFDGDTETGFDVSIGDDLVVAAPVESQAKLRKAFPAAATGSTPRWLSVQPANVRGLLRAAESAGLDPSAHVSVHMFGHPGLAPYDSLTFTTADTRRTDRFRALGAENTGRGIVQVPRYRRRNVTVDDLIDSPTVDRLLDETAWAILPIETVSAEDLTIPVRNSSGVEYRLFFGVGPDEAAELASESEDGFAYVNDGIAILPGYDGLEPYDTETAWFELDLQDGTTYTFPVSRDEALLYPERTQRSVERWELPLPDDRTRLNGMATHLETLGAGDLAAYVSGGADGFTEAREVLWTTGYGNVASSRVTGLRSGPNVIPVWLRDTLGLPDDTPLPGDLFNTEAAEAQATVDDDGRWSVDARDMPDVAGSVRAGHALGQRYGYENVEVLTDRGPLRLTVD